MTYLPLPERLLAAGFAKTRGGWARTAPLAAGFVHEVAVSRRGEIRSRIVDPAKLDAIAFDQFQNGYYAVGEKVGQAWNAGSALAKAALGK